MGIKTEQRHTGILREYRTIFIFVTIGTNIAIHHRGGWEPQGFMGDVIPEAECLLYLPDLPVAAQ